jgi:hypothetical protein
MANGETPRFKGVVVPGFGDWVVPPLNFRSLQDLQDRLATYRGDVSKESISVVVDAAFHAVRRNYPDVTRDEVLDALDLENMEAVFGAVMDVSGLRRKATEAQASTDPSIGVGSTGT